MMKRTLCLLLAVIMVIGVVPVTFVQAAGNNDVVYVDEAASMSELVDKGIVQTDEPATQPTMPQTPTSGLSSWEDTEQDSEQAPALPVPDRESQETQSPGSITLCNCGMETADIYNHSDNCALRQHYLMICTSGNANKIYDLWRNVGQVTRGFIEDYLNANDPEMLAKVQELRNAEAAHDDSPAEEEGAPARLPGEASATVDGVTLDAVGVPEGSSLTIGEPSEDAKDLVEQIVAAAQDDPEQVFFYDISVQNGESSDWQPDGTSVELKLTLPGKKLNQYTEVRIIHVDDEGNDSLIKGVVDENGDIVFETGGFSTFAGFTVDFTFGSAMVSIPGKTSTTLGTLFKEMKMPLNAADVVDVQFTDDTLLTVTQEENDWRLTSLVPFSTHETLSFTMNDGNTYEFMVTDAQYASIKTGVNGTVYNDDNGHSRWFADADGTLITGLSPGSWQSAYWAENAIVYIMGPGTFTIAIQPHKDLSHNASVSVAKVKMKQVRVQGGADVKFYVGSHFLAPDTGTYGSSIKAWTNIKAVEVIGTDNSQSLFYVEKGKLHLEGDSRNGSTIQLKLIGSGTANTKTFTAEPLVNLRESCERFTADYVTFTKSASGGVFSQAMSMKLFRMGHCYFESSVYRYSIWSSTENKWVYMNGGAIYLNAGKDGAEKCVDYFYLKDCHFTGSEAGSYGGAIFLGDRVRMAYINGCSFTSCTSGASGGAICLRATIGQLHVYQTTFTDCKAKKDGGAITAETFAMNDDANGNGTNFNRASEFRLNETTFTRCKATGEHSETNDGIGGAVNLAIQCQIVYILKTHFYDCEAKGGATNMAGGGLAFGYANLGDTGDNPTGDMRLPWTEVLLFHRRNGDGYLVDANNQVIKGDHDDNPDTAAQAIFEPRHDTGNKRVLLGDGVNDKNYVYSDAHQGWWLDDPNGDGNEDDALWRQRITFGNVIITDCSFNGARNTHQGGGFIVRTGCTMEKLTVTNTVFDDNEVADKGSAVFFNNCIIGETKFTTCTFKNNKVTNSIYSGGGTFRTVGQTSSKMTIDGCKFLDNVGNQAGGGLYWNAGQTRRTPAGTGGETKAIVKNCEFRRNTALKPDGIEDTLNDGITVTTISRYGGGIFCETDMSIEKCIFEGNESEIGGGLCVGVYNADYRKFNDDETTHLQMDPDTQFFYNMAKRGGGLAIRANATLAIDNDTQLKHTVEFNLGGAQIYNNGASEYGGGIYYIAETYQAKPDDPSYDPELDNAEVHRYIKNINLDSGTLYANCATKHGGGIYVESSYNTTVNMSNASIYGNYAGADLRYSFTKTDELDDNGNNVYTAERTKYSVSNSGGCGAGIYMTGYDAQVNVTGGFIGGYLENDQLVPYSNIAYGRTADATSGYGGGMAIYGGANLSITGGQIVYNEAQRDGGGISVNDNANVTMTGGSILNNKADEKANSPYQGIGGGIALSGGSMICYGGTIQGNEAYHGGGIALKSGASLEMEPLEITVEGETVITYGLVDDNTADKWGGGIYLAAATDAAHKSTLTIDGGTISNNTATSQNGGGVYIGELNTLEMTGGEIHNNSTATWGGGVYITGNTSKVTLSGGKIYSNTATHNGGGLCAEHSATILVDGCELYSNTADCGGAIFSTYSGLITINSGKVYNNTATTNGGAVSATCGSKVEIVGGEIYTNSAPYGGAFYITYFGDAKSTLNITNGKIYGNTASQNGGAIDLNASNATISGGEIYGNTALNGGAIFLTNTTENSLISELEITDGEIHDNTANYDSNGENGNGGAIYSLASKVTLNGGKLYKNHAMERGGAVYSNGSEIFVQNGEIYENRATNLLDPDADGAAGVGGALHIYTGSITISGGEIKSNMALGNAGGAYMDGATVIITDGLMSGNRAEDGAGGLYITGGTASIGGGEFISNTSATYGGGAYFNGADVTFTEGTFTDNASKNGGGLCITNSDVDFTGGDFTNNVADRGGAVFIRSSDVTIEDITVTGNFAKADERYGDASYRYGGGICVDTYGDGPANVTINGGTFANNSAKYGGGLWINNNAEEENKANVATIVISGGDIYGNHANSDGGGIWISGDGYATETLKTSLTVNGGVIGQNEQVEGSTGNTADGNGGGIYADGQAQVFIIGTTERHGEINKNSAKNGGGIFVITGGDLTVTNGHITNNTAVSPAGAEELLTGFYGEAYLEDLHGAGGGICVANGDGAYSTFTMNGNNVAIYGNQATFSGDDVFSNGRMTKLNVPMVSTMNLADYGFKPEGWFEDYNEGDSYYPHSLGMITKNGGSIVFDGERYEGVLRYRNATAVQRRFMHIKPEGANGENYVLGAENVNYAYVNKNNAYVAMTLGIPAAADDMVVIDYGSKVVIDAWENDLFMDQNDFANTQKENSAGELEDVHHSYVGKVIPGSVLEKDGVRYTTTKPTTGSNVDIYGNYFSNGMDGRIDNLKNGIMAFKLNNLSMDTETNFFYMVEHNGVWYYANVTVVPATTIYYEDNMSQVKYHEDADSKESLATWQSVGAAQDKDQQQDRPGAALLEGLDADNIYGYDGNINTSTYSNGSAHMVTVSRDKTTRKTTNARATFTFTGTGFDIVSLCSKNTGIVMVTVYEGEVVDFDNPPLTEERYVASYMVDTHYGYMYNEETGKWVIDPDSTTSLYQVPVIKADLTKVITVMDDPNTKEDETEYKDWGYGTYTAEIYVAPSFLEREPGYWSADFYLDAIRIYNPAGYNGIYDYQYHAVKRDADGNPVYENGKPVYELVTKTNNGTAIRDAHKEDGEAWPAYAELRNLFLDQKELGVESTEGILFIDGRGNTAELSEYKSWGPNNEVYLNPGEHIAFTLDTTNYARNVAGIHIGMRGLTGMGSVSVQSGESADDAAEILNTKLGTTDMYFDISARDAEGNLAIANKVVVISNPATVKDANGNDVANTVPISITNVKVTHTDVPQYNAKMMFRSNARTAQIALEILAVEDLVEPIVTPERPALSFSGMVSYNVFFSAENLGDLNAADLGLAVFSAEDPEGTVETAREVIMGATEIDGLYMITTSGVHAKYLGDKQYFRVFAKKADGTIVYSKMVSYSAVDYARNVLVNSDDVKLKQLVSAMLNYGAEAQKFFGYKEDDLMSKYLTEGDQAMLEGFSAGSLNAVGKVDASKVGIFASTGGFTRKSPAISFKGAFEINYFFTPANAVDGDMKLYFWNEDTYNAVSELTAENADKAVTMTLENGSYTATSDEIAAKYLDRTVYVAAVYESGGETYCSGVLPYSIAAYCQKPPAGVQDLAAAAAIYGCTAKQYFGV